jgi:hypothetical protein
MKSSTHGAALPLWLRPHNVEYSFVGIFFPEKCKKKVLQSLLRLCTPTPRATPIYNCVHPTGSPSSYHHASSIPSCIVPSHDQKLCFYCAGQGMRSCTRARQRRQVTPFGAGEHYSHPLPNYCHYCSSCCSCRTPMTSGCQVWPWARVAASFE